MATVIPFPPPLSPAAARLDPRNVFVDVDFSGTECVTRLMLRHPEQDIRMRLHWRVGQKSVVEVPPLEHVPSSALQLYNVLADRLVAFGFFLESHDETSANDVRLVIDAFFPAAPAGASS